MMLRVSRGKTSYVLWAGLALLASGADWPHWQGASRNGVVAEPSGFEGGEWPLKEIWQASVGDGSTSPIVVDGKLYTLGNRDDRDTVVCLDAATGKPIWNADYAAPPYGRKATGDEGMYRGPSSTPAFDRETKLLYTLSVDGDLACWNAAQQGKRVWQLSLYDKFDAPQRPKVGRSGRRDYGYTTSPLVHGDWVIVEVGAADGNLMAFDKRTGERRWASENRDPAGHAGCLAPLTVAGMPCVAVMTHEGLVVTRIDGANVGEQVAFVAWKTEFANSIASPAVQDNFVVITSDYNHGKIAKYEITLGGAREVWKVDHSSSVCTPVIHDGCVYWCWRKVHCLDLTSGKAKWIGPANLGDPGSCIVTSDERLIVWCENGTLLLMETASRSPAEPKVLARRDRLFETDAWPHVVLAGGRLFCKDRNGNIKCFAVDKTNEGSIASAPRDTPPADTPKPQPRSIKPVDLKTWPGTDDLVLAWAADSGGKAVGYSDGNSQAWKLKLAGDARIDASIGLTVSGGSAAIPDASGPLLAALKDRDEVTIEVVVTSASTEQSGPVRIVTFSTDAYHRNFTLGQEGERYILRLRTPATGENGQSPEVALASVAAGKRQHLLVTYRDGELVTYVDGREASRTDDVRGDFRNWSPQHFLLGDEHNGDRQWRGAIERCAILRRFVGADEAAKRFELCKP